MKTKKYLKVKCDQCEALAINGVACHEHGCPNSRRIWVEEDDKLVPGPLNDFDSEFDSEE